MRGFDFLSPKSLTAALRAIDGKTSMCKLLAGGTDVIPTLRDGTLKPRLVVDIGGIKALNYIREKQGWIRIGALTTMSDLLNSALVKKKGSLLWEAANIFGGPLVRNRATVGGNLADASPAADTAVPLLALGARVKLRSVKRQRTVPLNGFFTGYQKTVIEPGEILTEVAFPVPVRGRKQGYFKLGRRNAMAISIVSVAVLLQMKGKTCTDAAIALGAVAPTPLRVEKAEGILRGKKVDQALVKQCARLAVESVRPIDDIRASADYRRTLCEVLVYRMICQSLGLEDAD
jgi:carbon-monoxide dehydrogenase medium subunit